MTERDPSKDDKYNWMLPDPNDQTSEERAEYARSQDLRGKVVAGTVGAVFLAALIGRAFNGEDAAPPPPPPTIEAPAPSHSQTVDTDSPQPDRSVPEGPQEVMRADNHETYSGDPITTILHKIIATM